MRLLRIGILATVISAALAASFLHGGGTAPSRHDSKGGTLERKLGHKLAGIAAGYRGHRDVYGGGAREPRPVAAPEVPQDGRSPAAPGQSARDQSILVDAVARDDARDLLADLARLGLSGGSARGRIVSGRLPIIALERASALGTLAFMRPSRGRTSAGSATSQGDLALRSQQARAAFGVDGTGVTVGILSSTFDCSGTGLADDVASGDLPPGTTVLDDTACPGDDEGRAIAQIVHDVAPGAGILFHSGLSGQAGAAAAILELIDAGADVIVDDVYYPTEPMFQDGVIAQAVDEAVMRGVPLFAAAGNQGSLSYEEPFRPSGIPVLFDGDAHDFDPGPGVDVYQRISIPAEGELVLTLQWDSPFFSVSGPPGSSNDLDICLMDEPPTTILECGADLNTGGDAVETLTFFNDGAFGTEFNLVIELYEGSAPGGIKYILFQDGLPAEHDTASSTLFGHANAAGAAAVGAAFYFETPEFGTTPALVETSSSRGGTPIFFGAAGARLSVPLVRDQPALIGPDGVNTTFFGEDIRDPGDRSDNDQLPNFFGTSAAAAHVAAAAALVLDRNGALSPTDLYTALESTADDMDDPATAGFDTGFDFASGYGLCVAVAAVAAVPECGNEIIEPPEECDDGNPVDDDACGNDCLVNFCGDGIIDAGNGEVCDDGNGIDDDFCRNDCLPNFCGDGRLAAFSAELLINGRFEYGTFEGWTTTNLGDGSFVIATPGAATPTAGFATAPNADGGGAYALTDPVGPGTRALEQSFSIPATANSVSLAFQMFVNDQSGAGPIVDPIGLDHTGPPNQHARVDLLIGGAAEFETGAAVVRNLYLGIDPGPPPNPYALYAFDLTGDLIPGMTYDLRFAEVDNQLFLHLGVDNVGLLASLLEECDDGNNLDGDGCSAACKLEGCAAPGVVTGVSMLADGSTLLWNDQAGADYDLLRTEGLPAGSGAGEACVASATASASANDPLIPAPGYTFYYLVRARNGCGPGTYGFDSTGNERTSATCP